MGISGLGSRDRSGNRKRVVRRRRGALLALLASCAVLLGYAIPAQAVHETGAFQLDGDAMSNTNPMTPPAMDDWDKVCHEANPTVCPTGSNTSGATAVSWTDDGGTNKSIFTGGGSKDGLDLDRWAWKDGSVPDKDNLLHAFAARYSLAPSSSCEAGGNPTCYLLFFGSDRFANDGDAQQGFWFFQNKVTLGTGSVGGGTSFNGRHQNGDLLVLSNFSNGGTISTINIYEWDTTEPGNLRVVDPLQPLPNAKCGLTLFGDNTCAIANSADGTVAPWPFMDKVGSTAFRANEFLEGGLNLSRYDLENECFASVLAETRSSTSTSAVLKDFVLGQLGTCEVEVETTPSVGAGAIVVPGTSVTDGVTVTGRGVPQPPTPTGTVNFFLCGPIATGTCDSGRANAGEITAGTATISGSGAVATGTSSTVAPLAEGRYCFRAVYGGDANYPGVVTHVGDGDSECFYVAKPQSNTVSTPVDGNGTPITEEVLPGTTVHDRAVVTGTAAGGDPTGNVNFYVCGPIPTGTCDSGGVAVNGNPRALVSDGNPATYTSSTTSGGVAPTVPGRYCFRAEYEGSAIYQPSGDNTVTECFVVEKIPTITVTTPVDGSGTPTSSITLGQSIQDRAVVSGSLIVGDPTGTVDFYVCGPRPFDDTGTCDSGGTALPENPTLENPRARALVSDGNPATYTSSVTSGVFTPTSPGRYCFRAVYSGSTVYITSEDGSVTECFIVKDTTSTTTAQDWLPNDSATVRLSGNGPASGTVTCVLKSGTCAAPGATLYSQPDVVLDSSGQARTSNTTIKVTTSASVIWETTFTPSDPTTVVGSTHCESTSLTIVN